MQSFHVRHFYRTPKSNNDILYIESKTGLNHISSERIHVILTFEEGLKIKNVYHVIRGLSRISLSRNT